MKGDPFQAARELLERGDPDAAVGRVTEIVARLRNAPPEERWAAALVLRDLIRVAHRHARVLARRAADPMGDLPASSAPGDLLSWPA